MKAKLTLVVLVLAALAAPGLARADTVTDWNRTMVAALEAAHIAPQPSTRIGAIVQTSVFDAVNGIEKRYAPYHVQPAAAPGASRDAAAANAAYTALVALLPSEQPLFDQQLATTMAEISDSPRIQASQFGAVSTGARPSRRRFSAGVRMTEWTRCRRHTWEVRLPATGSPRLRSSGRRFFASTRP
jgi:hypothetical protein